MFKKGIEFILSLILQLQKDSPSAKKGKLILETIEGYERHSEPLIEEFSFYKGPVSNLTELIKVHTIISKFYIDVS